MTEAAMLPEPGRAMRAVSVAVACAWVALCVFCVIGFGPTVDAPAHGAELQTLVELLKGQSDVAAHYRITFPLGYGLWAWLCLPLAWVTSGAFAVRAMLLVTLLLYPVSLMALLKAWGRSPYMVLLGLTLAFNVSYWYGLVSGLFAQPLLFFTLAQFEVALRAVQRRESLRKHLILLNILAASVLLSHLLAFVVLVLLLGVRVLWQSPRVVAARVAAFGLLVPLCVSLPKAIQMAHRAVVPEGTPPTEYNLESHYNWFIKNYKGEGRADALVPLILGLLLVALALREHRARLMHQAAFAMTAAMAVLFAITPKTLSGIFLISVRLPVIAGALSLLLVDFRRLPKWLVAGALVAQGVSLLQTGEFHHRFRHEVDGLLEVMPPEVNGVAPRPPTHGYLSLVGNRLLGSHHFNAEHLGQWVTALRGGVGHDFFADADHHIVRFTEHPLPATLARATEADFKQFEALYVYGTAELPVPLQRWPVAAHHGPWRRLERPPEGQ